MVRCILGQDDASGGATGQQAFSLLLDASLAMCAYQQQTSAKTATQPVTYLIIGMVVNDAVENKTMMG